jgi:hypothetical protein
VQTNECHIVAEARPVLPLSPSSSVGYRRNSYAPQLSPLGITPILTHDPSSLWTFSRPAEC